MAKSISALALLAAAAAHAAGPPAAGPPAAGPPAAYPFSLDSLLAEAKRRASTVYAPQRNSVPAPLDKLSPEQYHSIRFNPDMGIWRAEELPFRLELLPVGFNFQTTVTISTVDGGMAKDLIATPAMFEMAPNAKLGLVSLPLSGFRVRSRINSPKIWDEFLVFQGASYFRAVAQHLVYGLSARGLAIDTAEPSGEEFPTFTHFWIEQPAPKAAQLVIYALLESQSATGAFRFTVQPGAETLMDVDATLFPRAELKVVGIGPLTSMFLFDETNRGRLDDYRPEVHDSDGLQIDSQSGELIWRPLANPVKLQVSTFTAAPPHGFGLVQRSREQGDYQDFENLYERRPSAWVEPTSDWGAGSVELVEIPSGRETNDNIVAFWRPAAALAPGRPAHFAYRIIWNGLPKLPRGVGMTLATRSGASLDGKRRVFLVDFVGAGDKVRGLRLDLGASAGKISNVNLLSNAALHGMRASFEIDPNGAEIIEMRLRVMRGAKPITETWLYRWTAS